MKSSIATFLVALLFLTASAHEDAIITWENGKFSGLPEKYQPAVLDVENQTFSIAGQKMVIPKCYGKFFPESSRYEISGLASWYHDTSSLPPYLALVITDAGEVGRHFFQVEPFKPYCSTKNEELCHALNYKVIGEECINQFKVILQ